VKTSASTTTVSPVERFIGNLPQSTRGVMFSMTTRTLLIRAQTRSIGCQYQHPQGWQAQIQRMEVAMRGQRGRLDGTEVANAASPVLLCIAVEPLAPDAAARHTDLIVVARQRREVERHEGVVTRPPALA